MRKCESMSVSACDCCVSVGENVSTSVCECKTVRDYRSVKCAGACE